jgi:hypothetical protein
MDPHRGTGRTLLLEVLIPSLSTTNSQESFDQKTALLHLHCAATREHNLVDTFCLAVNRV